MMMVLVALNPLWSRIWFPLVLLDRDGSKPPLGIIIPVRRKIVYFFLYHNCVTYYC